MMENADSDVSQFDLFTAAMRSEFREDPPHTCSASDTTNTGSARFTTSRNLSLMMGSWNVNAKDEESHLLSQWLRPADVLASDLVVIGLQELIALSASNTVIGSTNTLTGYSDNSSSISYNACERWLSKLLTHLNHDDSNHNSTLPSEQEEDQEQEQEQNTTQEEAPCSSSRRFTLLSQLSMVGLAIFVFVRDDVRSRISGVQARSIARGGGGLLGNKGAVCVRLEVDDTSMCFCSAHLCAHRVDVVKRNEVFRLIYNTPVTRNTVTH